MMYKCFNLKSWRDSNPRLNAFNWSPGSTTQHGRFPWYGERCASTMATTFSSGDYDEKQVVRKDPVLKVPDLNP